MEFALSGNGLMVHDRQDWPCAVCRPERIADSRGYCICVRCARRVMTAVWAGAEDARALLAALTEALAVLEPQVLPRQLAVN
jgi:hypothetical protein